MKSRIPLYGKVILILLLVLVVLGVLMPLVSAPIPGHLFSWYLAVTLVVLFLYVSSTEAFWEEFAAPIRRLLLAHGPVTKPLRLVVFIAMPLVVGWYFASRVSGEVEPPGGLRVVHPAPPPAVKFRGKSIDLKEVSVNPLRADEARLAEHMEQGRVIYYQNCFFCHGDALDGKGHFAKGFNPTPANFQDPGTIAQLSESFLFWRIAKGGPGLPGNSAPWDSAMPVWENMLSETEIWQVVLYLYQTTGYKPRVMDEGGGH